MRPAVVLVALLSLAVVLVACGGPSAPTQSPGPAATQAPTARPPDGPLEAPPPVSDVPQDILDAIVDQAASLAGVPLAEVTIVTAETRVWNDGSLGCPEPGEMYTQVLVEGYQVVVEADGNQYDFRVGRTGNFKLCPP